MAVYAIAFPKGGTTKTTTAVEHASLLAARGRRVLVIDLDEQGTLTSWLGFTDATEIHGTAAGVLTGHATIEEAATEAPSLPGVDVLVGTYDLSRVDTYTVEDLVTSLRDMLPHLAPIYDDVVIDAPPSLNGLTMAGLAAADVVIAPVSCDGQAVDQMARYMEVLAFKIAKRIRPGQRIHYVIPTRYDGRRLLDREVKLELRRVYGEVLCVTEPIPEAQAVKDSYLSALPVGRYDPESKPAQAYAAVLGKIIEES